MPPLKIVDAFSASSSSALVAEAEPDALVGAAPRPPRQPLPMVDRVDPVASTCRSPAAWLDRTDPGSVECPHQC